MSELVQDREPAQPGASDREFIIAGIIGGSMILLVVLLFGLFFSRFGSMNYSIGKVLAGCILVSLIAGIPGMLIGGTALHVFEKKEPSGARLIVKSALAGILGGGVVAAVLAPFLAFGIACC